MTPTILAIASTMHLAAMAWRLVRFERRRDDLDAALFPIALHALAAVAFAITFHLEQQR
jgi:hypothetical protein